MKLRENSRPGKGVHIWTKLSENTPKATTFKPKLTKQVNDLNYTQVDPK